MHGEHCEQSHPEKYPHLNIRGWKFSTFLAAVYEIHPSDDRTFLTTLSFLAISNFNWSIRKEGKRKRKKNLHTFHSRRFLERKDNEEDGITAAISTRKRNGERRSPRRSIYPAVIVFFHGKIKGTGPRVRSVFSTGGSIKSLENLFRRECHGCHAAAE